MQTRCGGVAARRRRHTATRLPTPTQHSSVKYRIIINGQLIALRRYNYKNVMKLKFRLYLPKNTVAYDKH